jgi:hypothetical protein
MRYLIHAECDFVVVRNVVDGDALHEEDDKTALLAFEL